MSETLFQGSGVAIVTPFTQDGVDYNKLEELIEYQVKNLTDAIIICGTTGESSTMADEEHKKAIEFTVQTVNKRIPVIAGTGSNDTRYCIELSQEAQNLGADGLLSVTPYYNKTTQKGLVAHFTAIANSVNIPIILYNVPSRTGVNICPQTCYELSKVDNIIAIKEASGDVAQAAHIKSMCGNDLDLYSGNDDLIVPLLSLGGKGVISVAANVMPKEVHDVCQLYFDGKTKESCDLFLKMLDIINRLFIEVNPIPIKTAMNLLGFNVGNLRLPLTEMCGENLEILKNSLTNYGFILKN